MSVDPLQLLRNSAAQLMLIAVGGLGGWIFSSLGLPAPWISGSMTFAVILCAFGLAPVMLAPMRDMAMLLAGLSMGTSVTPDMLSAASSYPASLVLLCVCMMAMSVIATAALTLLRGWAPRDAFFASAPGALTAVLAVAVDVRADLARIAIVQIIRLFILVILLPPIIDRLSPIHAEPGVPRLIVSAPQFALIMVAALAGWLILSRARVAAAVILGAMFGSALLTGTGAIEGQIPPPLANLGFVMVGCFIGQRFRGVEWAMLARLLPDSVISVLAGLAVAAAFSALIHQWVGIPFTDAMVALAPGGLEAMTILAISLGLDPVYVGVHHTVRFIFVGLWIPFAMKLFPRILHGRARPKPSDA